MKKADLIVSNAAELVTVASGGRQLAGKNAGEIGVIKNGYVAIAQGRIVGVGSKNILSEFDCKNAEIIDASGKTALPGFVDAHTHLVFGGSREEELELKARGVPYLEILAKGGGILKTVRQTRQASEETLVENGVRALKKMLEFGTTTIEAKSGYGLDLDTELKILRASKTAGEKTGADVVRTFLGAHAIPEGKSAEEYTKEVMGMLSQACKEAEYCDVFCEKNVFSVKQSREILLEGKKFGLKPRVHADELNQTGGAELAAEINAASADHLICASQNGIEQMAKARATAVFLPCTSLSSLLPYANARAFIDAGVPIALGTDYNPNCLTESMQLAIALACRHLRLSAGEAIAAATINAAYCIGRGSEVGSIEVGKKADLVVLDAPNHRFLPYHFGVNLVEKVVKNGQVVINNG